MEAGDQVIMHSLKRSKIRIVVLLFIAHQYYGLAGLNDICKGLNVCATNVLGALNGSKGRYKYEDSLVGLGLLERIERDLGGQVIIYYKLTEKGYRIARMLEKEPMTALIMGEY